MSVLLREKTSLIMMTKYKQLRQQSGSIFWKDATSLIAEFAGEVEEERGRRFTKRRFLRDVNDYLTTRAFQEIEKENLLSKPQNLQRAFSFD